MSAKKIIVLVVSIVFALSAVFVALTYFTKAEKEESVIIPPAYTEPEHRSELAKEWVSDDGKISIIVDCENGLNYNSVNYYNKEKNIQFHIYPEDITAISLLNNEYKMIFIAKNMTDYDSNIIKMQVEQVNDEVKDYDYNVGDIITLREVQ